MPRPDHRSRIKPRKTMGQSRRCRSANRSESSRRWTRASRATVANAYPSSRSTSSSYPRTTGV